MIIRQPNRYLIGEKLKYIKVKDLYDIYSDKELIELKSEALPNSFHYINYYRNTIMRLIKTIEFLKTIDKTL